MTNSIFPRAVFGGRHWSALRLGVSAGRWAALAGIAGLAFFGSTPLLAGQKNSSNEGHWEGAIEVPGNPLGIAVDLTFENERWTGTIDIPQQGGQALALNDVSASGDSVSFSIANVPGKPTFVGSVSAERIEGEMKQGPATLRFWLGREALPGPARPQMPQPPFPYASEEVSFHNGEIELAGTLVIPAGLGPHPAVVLITGSGAQDRDEALMGHRPFLVIADALARRGVASLRCDDRGVGGSSGSTVTSTTADFAADALAGVALLRSRPEIDGARIGLIGHSEGGVVAPIAAAQSTEVSFLVLLAGTGVPLREVLSLQTDLLLRASGASDAKREEALESQRQALAVLGTNASSSEKRDHLRPIVEKQIRASAGGAALSGSDLEQAVNAAIAGVLNPWFQYIYDLDPREYLRQVVVPVLALNGTLDKQVDADQNLAEIGRALIDARNPDITLRRLPGLNHLFQPATTGGVEEYAQIETTIAPEVLVIIGDWIVERTGR